MSREVDPSLFREAMSRYASGVTLVTARVDGRDHGFTASSFASVSAEPALVLVCLARSSRSFDAFRSADAYAIHFLEFGQEELATHFASRSDDKFAAADLDRREAGPTVLHDCLALLHCAREEVVEAGDHVILIGRVLDVELGQGEPLVYHRRTFSAVTAAAPVLAAN